MNLRSDGSGRRCRALFALVALCTLATVHAQREFVTVPNDGLIVGRVVDADRGTPVSGAIVALVGKVTIQRDEAMRITGTAVNIRMLTGPDGYFVFRDLTHADFSIVATKHGYADGAYGRTRAGGSPQQVTLTEADPRREVVVRMWKHGAITGRAVDEAGEPLVNIVIQAYSRVWSGGRRRFLPSGSATTDDRGVYRLANLAAGEYIVGASSRQVTLPMSIAGDPQAIRTAPMREMPIGPIPRPGSEAALQLGDSAYSIPTNAATPPPVVDGRLFIYPVTFHPAATSPVEAVTLTIGSGEERDGIDLQLRPARSVRVSGMLDGPPDARAMRRLRLVPDGIDIVDASEPVTLTDSNGAFVFPAVTPGQYTLQTTTRTAGPPGGNEGLLWTEVPVTVGETDIDGLTAPLHPGLAISGELRFDGTSPKPAANALQRAPVVVERASTFSAAFERAASNGADANHRFSAAGLPAGRYFVRVADSPVGWMFKGAMHNGRDLSETPIDLQSDLSGVVIEFTDRWTGLRGTVATANGQPDSDVVVILFPTDREQWTVTNPVARRLRSTRATPKGEFAFSPAPTGEYYVVAVADEDAADWTDPRFLDALSSAGTRITIGDGDFKTIALRTKDLRQ